METTIIRERIYEIRGQKVMLDFDLAELYEVETKALNQAVKRNINRFPEDFMFKLTEEEWGRWSQMVTTSGKKEEKTAQNNDNQLIEKVSPTMTPSNPEDEGRWSQFVTTSKGEASAKFRKKGVLPYAFTEHGVSMLASVLRSEKAVNMSIAVVRAFIALKQYAIRQNSLSDQLEEIRDRLGEHDVQLNSIYEAIENLLDEKTDQKSWEDRERIGFKR